MPSVTGSKQRETWGCTGKIKRKRNVNQWKLGIEMDN